MKTLTGVVIGMALTFLFLKYGYSPPTPFQLPDKLKALPEQLIASSFVEDGDSKLQQKQNAIAILIKHDPDYFIKIDNAIENRFTKEATRRIAERKIGLLKDYSEAFPKAMDKSKYPALSNYLEKRYGVKDAASLKKEVLIERFREDALVFQKLKERYPEYSDEKIAEIILER